jgi:NADPH:quinone reductase-like Zn-dependent oxidoreductase
MFAVTAARADAENPLNGLELTERPDPAPAEGWTTVDVRAASLNHHDVWTLRGVGIDPSRLPIVLGCDAAGVDEDGNEVVVHAVIGDPDAGGGDETLDPRRSLLSEKYDGTFATKLAVPRRNLLPKPAALSFEDASCLPTAYLTAYRMLFDKSGLQPGSTILVQGAGGGVATALILLGRAAGYRVWVTSRSEAKRDRAVKLGADQAFETGARLPERVDGVMETVGEATWAHSLRSLRPGGRIVISGATSGAVPPADLSRVFFTQLSIVGSTMGTRDQLARLLRFCEQSGVRPLVDRTLPLAEARDGFAAMIAGELTGKVVFTVLEITGIAMIYLASLSPHSEYDEEATCDHGIFRRGRPAGSTSPRPTRTRRGGSTAGCSAGRRTRRTSSSAGTSCSTGPAGCRSPGARPRYRTSRPTRGGCTWRSRMPRRPSNRPPSTADRSSPGPCRSGTRARWASSPTPRGR